MLRVDFVQTNTLRTVVVWPNHSEFPHMSEKHEIFGLSCCLTPLYLCYDRTRSLFHKTQPHAIASTQSLHLPDDSHHATTSVLSFFRFCVISHRTLLKFVDMPMNPILCSTLRLLPHFKTKQSVMLHCGVDGWW